MPAPPVKLAALRAVAERLDALKLDYAFTGGAIVNLLLDHPYLSPVRPTDDVDVILEVVTARHYAEIEERLRKLGFDHDMRPGAPCCRWMLGEHLTVDIMPVSGSFLGLNTQWFSEALGSAKLHEVSNTSLRLISPVAFLATKYTAFLDRGDGDYYGSHDMEDFVTVIDGRENIVTEVNDAPTELREYIAQAIANLLANPFFEESLPGHLPFDQASQQRLPGLRAKLLGIAKLATDSK
ncbi:hypothetical protein Ga0100231_024825 [Opitutaceae bacterium TAV4]|nr:hypothetical protein Ga0100231_024825 [Opitutaceae bacterium TAV4]RRK00942.1 hypothetical protein Ga0100230_024560 [Opitutaceae bacterium TAV3]